MVLLAIHVAARDGDLVAMRRELAQGVSPNAPTRHHGLKPLHLLCGWQRGKSAFSTRSSEGKSADNLEERLACFHALVGAGADIHANDNHNASKCRHAGWHAQWTPLHFAVVLCRVSLVAALIEAGANVNVACAPMGDGASGIPLALAVGFGASIRRRECIALLLRAGAAVNRPDLSLDKAWMNPSLYPILLRAGAAMNPIPTHPDPYLAKILKAGGFRGNGFQNYERARRNAINAIFIPKFAHLLPPELVRRVVEFYWLHAPYY